MQKSVVIVGSINVDIVVGCDRWPQPGETLLGTGNYQAFGGKGANQAVAAARLGNNVQMLGCVGDDSYGEAALANLKKNGVDTSACEIIPSCSTGLAFITVCQSDNTIIVVQGASLHVTPEYINRHKAVLAEAAVVVLQLEIPLETVCRTADLCKELGIPCILNPAPYAEIPKTLIDAVNYITPNSTEADLLAKNLFGNDSSAHELFQHYKKKTIITRGSKGVEYWNEARNETSLQPSIAVTPVDTTGAGDTFNGAFAVALRENMNLQKAVEFSVCASGLSVTGLGAQGGMPNREEVEKRLS